MRLILLVIVALCNCSSPTNIDQVVQSASTDVTIIVSYSYYPVPSEYGDTIHVYQKLPDGSEDFITKIYKDNLDTIYTSKGCILKAYYTYKYPNTLFYVKETLTVVDNYRWLISNTHP